MNWKEHKKKLLEDPEFKKEYEALEPEYKLASDLDSTTTGEGANPGATGQATEHKTGEHRQAGERRFAAISIYCQESSGRA